MEIRNTVRTQQIAARFAGFFYLFTMATALFAEDYALGGVWRSHDPGATARNIEAAEQLFRLGIVCELVTVAGVAALIVALYVLLNTVNRGLALLALSWRMLECVLLAMAATCPLVVLRLLSGADYLAPYNIHQLQTSAYVALEAHSIGYLTGMFFYSLGSTAFSYLLFKSHYVPRLLPALGVLGSLIVFAGTVVHFAAPQYAAAVESVFWIPVAAYEVLLGLWLLFLGVKISPPEARAAA